MDIVQTAVYEAANAITKRYPGSVPPLEAAPDYGRCCSRGGQPRHAREAHARRKKRPSMRAYEAALSKIADGHDKTAGIAIGAQAARPSLHRAAADGAAAGTPIDRTPPRASTYLRIRLLRHAMAQRKPWLMTSAAEFVPVRRGATSAVWARVQRNQRTTEAKSSTRRSAEQTEIARLLEFSLPPIYTASCARCRHAGAASDAERTPVRGRWHHARRCVHRRLRRRRCTLKFWRPAHAIRNGDLDGNQP